MSAPAFSIARSVGRRSRGGGGQAEASPQAGEGPSSHSRSTGLRAAAAAVISASAQAEAELGAVEYDEGEGSNNGSTTTDAGGAGSGSGSAGGSVDEPGSTKRKRKRGPAPDAPPTKSVHPNQEASDRWFTNTHIAMVGILSAMFSELQDRHLRAVNEDVAADEAILGFMQRIKDIGQGVTAFTISRLQTHSLIANTVQLCHRMAADKYCCLAKGYPPEDDSDFDYDFSTDAGTEGEDDEDEEEDGDDDNNDFIDSSERAKGGSLGLFSFAAGGGGRPRPYVVANDGGVHGDRGSSSSTVNGSSKGKTKKGKKKRAAASRAERAHQGSLRERYDAVVVKLAERAKWSSERAGRPRKDVITRAREIAMAIYIDSYFKRMLSKVTLNENLGHLESILGWADRAGEDDDAKEVLREGLPLNKVGLANIALTAPE